MNRREAIRPDVRLRERTLSRAIHAVVACAAFIAVPWPTSLRASGSVITVQNCNDSGAGSLRDAIAHAASGDHIVIPEMPTCSTISLDSGALVIENDVNGQPFTALDIEGPPSYMRIDGGGMDRVIVHNAGTSATLTLAYLAFANGHAEGSGGCVAAQGNLILSNIAVGECVAGVVSGDTALGEPAFGGGVYAAGSVAMQYGLITGNALYGGAFAEAIGGGIFAGAGLNAYAVTITDNHIYSPQGAAFGGGFAAGHLGALAPATVTLTSSSISDNDAASGCNCGALGGGGWFYGQGTFVSDTFTGNQAIDPEFAGIGGALYQIGGGLLAGGDSSTSTISLSTFQYNVADLGGAVASVGDMVVDASTFGLNTANMKGGGIYLGEAGTTLSFTLSNSTVYDNCVSHGACPGGGGGIANYLNDVTIVNSTISGNRARRGAGMYTSWGSINIDNSTIADNEANVEGGGLYWRVATATGLVLHSTIVANNTAAHSNNDLSPSGLSVGGSNNLIMSAPGVDLPPDTLSADPLLLTLQNNGGPTLTQALAPGSPAIDAGSNPLDLPNDQRGDGFARSSGAAVDIGAYEWQRAEANSIFANGFDP